MGAVEGGDRVAVLVPMRVELVPVVRRLRLAREGDGDAAVWRGRRGEREVVAALIGVGPAPAAAATVAVLGRWAPDHVLVAGVAGAIDGSLRIGDLVRPTWARDLATGDDVAATPLGAERFDEAGIVTTAGGTTRPSCATRVSGVRRWWTWRRPRWARCARRGACRGRRVAR